MENLRMGNRTVEEIFVERAYAFCRMQQIYLRPDVSKIENFGYSDS